MTLNPTADMTAPQSNKTPITVIAPFADCRIAMSITPKTDTALHTACKGVGSSRMNSAPNAKEAIGTSAIITAEKVALVYKSP